MEQMLRFHFAGMNITEIRSILAVSISLGTLYCFLGYRMLKFALGVTGFVLAGSTAAVLTAWSTDGNAWLVAAAACIGGLCGACALFFLYKVGVFGLGLAAGTLVSCHALAGHPQSWVPSVTLAAAVFGGLGALLVERPVVTLATACLGGWSVVHSLAFFIVHAESIEELQAQLSSPDAHWTMLGCWLALSLAGAITQFMTHRKPDDRT